MMAVRTTDDGCLKVSKPMLTLCGAIIAVTMSLAGWSLSALYDSQGTRFISLAATANETAKEGVAGVRRLEARVAGVREQLVKLNENVIQLRRMLAMIDGHEKRIDGHEKRIIALEEWRKNGKGD